ncbi:DUF262 domain-containing protein [Hyphomicrobium sp.]|jgi:hypothetical protein|uniref:DUF262 domain-containing protein n=1 Tax=Hyphomicrobium sp. TaxID=82 RepID=UPI003562F0B4
MQPHKLTVNDVFEKERRYVIPLYQRAYVWNRLDQWEPLWDDIRRATEEQLDAQADAVTGTHFLGAVVWSLSKIVGKSVPRAEVVDGQQRLTTLQIFLAALRDLAREIGSASVGRLERWTINPDRNPALDEEAFKVWPSLSDRDPFTCVLTAGSRDNLLRNYNGRRDTHLPRMAAAYLYFDEAIRDFAGADEALAPLRIDAITGVMLSALQFVVIELEHGDDPQVIFETLNARGQPLLPSDLIRNFVFLQAANLGAGRGEALYESYWKQFDATREDTLNETGENRFWYEEEQQGRLKRPRIDLFMFYYLTLHTEKELNIGQLFREFSRWRAGQKTSLEDFLRDLKTSSEHFSRLLQPKGDDRLARLARRLQALDTGTVYPLLLFLTTQPNSLLPRVERDQTLADLESFLVRRFICGLTNKSYNKFFLSVLVRSKQAAAEGKSIADAVRNELLRSKEPTAVWPSDDDFARAWATRPLYVKSRPDRAAMVLRAIEASLRTSRNENVSLPDDLTVEHLLPQKGSLEDYTYAAAMPLIDDETPQKCRIRIIDTVGNLTLLTQPLNSSISNGPFPGKATAIIEDSDLRLNAWLRRDPPAVWNEAKIIERSKALFAYALTAWPKAEASVKPADVAVSNV